MIHHPGRDLTPGDSYPPTRRSDALQIRHVQRLHGFRRDLERSHPVAMFEEIRGEDQLVDVRLTQETRQFLLYGIRATDSSHTQSGFHKEPFRFAPEARCG